MLNSFFSTISLVMVVNGGLNENINSDTFFLLQKKMPAWKRKDHLVLYADKEKVKHCLGNRFPYMLIKCE